MPVSMLRVPHGLWAGGGGLEHVRALLHTFLLHQVVVLLLASVGTMCLPRAPGPSSGPSLPLGVTYVSGVCAVCAVKNFSPFGHFETASSSLVGRPALFLCKTASDHLVFCVL